MTMQATTGVTPRAAATGWRPIYMRNVDLILGGDDGENFKCQLRSVKLSPNVNITRIKTLCPTGQYSNVDDPEWSLELGYLYGVSDTAGEALADYLLTHMGEQVPFEFRPIAGQAGYEGVVTVVPGPIGGDQGSFSEQSVTLPVEGQPAPVAAGARTAPTVDIPTPQTVTGGQARGSSTQTTPQDVQDSQDSESQTPEATPVTDTTDSTTDTTAGA